MYAINQLDRPSGYQNGCGLNDVSDAWSVEVGKASLAWGIK